MKKGRPINLDKLKDQVSKQTDPQKIKSKTQQVVTKNEFLQQEIDSILEQLEQTRQKNRKAQKQILESVKDRIDVNEKITANSAYPREMEERRQCVKQLADRYQFMEEENVKFEANYQLIESTLSYYLSSIMQLQSQIHITQAENSEEMETLQKEFAHYKNLQEIELKKNAQLQTQYKRVKQHYEHIDQQIAACRDNYAIAEGKAKALQFELSQKVKEFQDRQQGDRQALQEKKKFAHELQEELVHSKAVVNSTEDKNMELRIKDIEIGYHTK